MKKHPSGGSAGKFIGPVLIVSFLLILQSIGPGSLPARAAPAPVPGVVDLPAVALNLPGYVFLGETVNFSVTFNNPGEEEQDIGYGPFVDVVLDSTGADADSDGGPYDGLGTTSISASYLGTAIPAQDFFVLTFNALGQAVHPFLRDDTGALVTVGAPPGFGPGDTLVVVRLPFGSFTPEQPAATIDFSVDMSDLADLGTPLEVRARGGYEFGYTPLDDWCCGDAAWPDAVTPWSGAAVTPTLLTLSKTYSGPEGETATGPNFMRQYTVTVDIAEGQTLSDLTITDLLPDNLQYVSVLSSTPPGAVLDAEPAPGGAQNPPDNALVVRWPVDVTGGAGAADASVTFQFFVPRDDADGGRVIDPVSGDDVTSCNHASASGTWEPIDPRDLPGGVQTLDPAGCEHILTDKSIAIQKGAAIVGGGDPAPGQGIQYSLTFQVSDFFAFDSLEVEDVISDGQHLDTSFTPALTVNGNGFTLPAGGVDAGNLEIDCYYSGAVVGPGCDAVHPPVVPPGLPPHTPAETRYAGTTILTFKVSDEIILRAVSLPDGPAKDQALLGHLLGGCVPLAGSADPDCGSHDDGGTTATLTFRTVILQDFSDYYPSGDHSVDQGDVLTDRVLVGGSVLSTDDFTSQGTAEDDDSAASVTLGRDELSKDIYAVNGSTSLPVDGSGNVLIKPGDTVTYRLTYGLPISNVEDLYFSDFLPLPVFHVGDPDEDGTPGPAWTFSAAGGIPASGVVTLGPADTFYAYVQDGLADSGPYDTDSLITGNLTASAHNPTPSSADPIITSNSANNYIEIVYYNYDDTRNQSGTVDLLFTVTVSDEPFADRLYLTNQAHAFEGSTNAGTADANAIVQVILTQPLLRSNKGVVWTDNVNAVYDPDPPASAVFGAFVAAGTPRWSGVIGSSDLSANPIDSNLLGADAGDIVTFAITVENVGSSGNGAFDVTIQDLLPDQFQVPSGGLNLQVFRGSGTLIGYDGLAQPADCTGVWPGDPCGPDASAGTADDLFGAGVQMVDPGAGEGACQTHTLADGNNILIITYDLQLRDDVPPGTVVNTHALVNYAGSDGGPNHLAEPLEDEAETTIILDFAKTLLGTEIVSAVNGSGQAVIGELVTYQVVFTVPEGVAPGVQIVDILDSGLAFVDLDPASPPELSPGVSITGSTVPVVTNSGRTITFDLGDVTNADRDNAVAETITLTYRAVVLNVSSNQGGTTLGNAAELTWGADGSLAVAAADITVIEPLLDLTKAATNVTKGIDGDYDAGDRIRYTLTLQHAGASAADAFDVTLADPLPTYGGQSILVDPVLVSVTDTGGVVDATYFELVGSNPAGWTFQTLAGPPAVSFDLPYDAARTITIVIEGDLSGIAFPTQSIINIGTVYWTSLDGEAVDRSSYNTNSDERTGAGGVGSALDDYADNGSITFVVDNVVPVKSITATSEAFTGVLGGIQRLVVGEIVRYRLQVQIPEGTSVNLQLRDILPSGLAFLNDDTAMVAFVCSNTPGCISSSTLGTAPVVVGDETTVSTVIPAYALTGAALTCGTLPCQAAAGDPYFTPGNDPYFNLGTLTNNDSDASQEFVVLEFNALVLNYNTAPNNNQSNTQRLNNFQVWEGGVQRAVSANVEIRVAEPVLTLTKTIQGAAPVDAGDLFTYRLVITNSSSGSNRSTAFDLVLTDALDANLTDISILGVTPSVTDCTGTILAAGWTMPVNAGGSVAGQTVTVTADCLDPTRTITVDVQARVAATAPVGYTVLNAGAAQVKVTYTSLPDTGTTGNPTGSDTPGASGANFGERNGSTYPGGLNDYGATATYNLTLASPSLSKSDSSPAQATIGETVDFDVTITLPEGVTPAAVLTDAIPAGMQYVSHQVITSAAPLAQPYAGTFTNDPPPFACLGTCGSGDDFTLTFGDITTSADNDPDNNTFVIRVTLRLLDLPANQDGATLTNGATLAYTGGSAADTGAASVIEARIETLKDVDPTSSVQAGDVLTYTVRFTNTGNSPAYDVTAVDTLAQGVGFTALAACVDHNALAVPSSATDNGSTVDFVGNLAGSWDIPIGGWIECTYTATAQTGLYMNGNHVNTVDADWTSLDGSQPGVERVYDDSGSSLFDAAQDQDTAVFSADAPTLAKDDNGVTQVVIGDTITFTLTIGGELGTYRALVIRDVLPAGLIYNGDAVVSGFASAPAPVVSAPNDGSVPVTLTWTFGDVYKNSADATITYSARVADAISNSIGHVLVNDASLDHQHADGTPAAQLTASENSTVAEPIIATTKSVLPTAGVEAGDVLTYTVRFTNTGTSTAYEVTALDVLTQGVAYDAGSASCTYDYPGVGSGSMPVLVSVGVGTLTFDGNPTGSWDIPATNPDSYIECTYTVTAQPGILLDGAHVNTIDADWTSQGGLAAGERNYDDSVDRPGVDGAQDTAQASFATEGAGIVKDDGGVTQAVVGETIYVTLTIAAPLGTLQDASVVDTLPAGLIYGGVQSYNGITPGPGASVPVFSASAPNDGSAPVVLTWGFGDATVTASPVTITYQAVVANVDTNVQDTDLVNEVHFYYTDVAGNLQDESDTDGFSIDEPDLSVDKTHAAFAVTPDAGDQVHYIVTIAPTASSQATAYDVHFTDTLPGDLTLTLASIQVTLNGGAAGVSNASSGNTVDLTISSIPNTPGTSVVIEYLATLANTVTPAQLISNTADLTWTSTPGSNPDERDGSGVGPNDYHATDSDSFNVRDPAFSKTLAEPSAIHTTPPNTTIGETFYFELTVTLPEGTTPALVIVDDLPVGMAYVSGSASLAPGDFNGSIHPADPQVTCAGSCGSGDDVTFTFNQPITVAADGVETNNDFAIRFRAVIVNEAGNQDGDDLTNTATMTIGGVDYSDSDSVHIVEPLLTLFKAVDDPYPGADQVLTFTLTVAHDPASAAGAFDLLIYDDLPPELTLDPSTVTISLGGGAAGAVDNSSGNRVEVTVTTFPPGASAIIQFEAAVSSAVVVGDVITNSAFVEWTSMPGDLTANPEERTGSGGGPNDYVAGGLVALDINIQKSLSKTISGHSLGDTPLPQVAIGEILTYDLFFNVPVGETTAVRVTDTFDLGLAFVDCVVIAPSAGISTSVPGDFAGICAAPAVSTVGDPANPASAGRQVVFDFGDLENTSGDVGSITIQYRGVVLDVQENRTGVELNNSAALDWSVGSLSASSPAPVTIVEPDLTIEKTADVSSALPGAVITFTLTVGYTGTSSADAYDVLLEDVLPTGLTYVPGSLTYVSGILPNRAVTPPPALDDTNPPTLRVYWDSFPSLPSGESVIQFQAQLGNLGHGQSVSNTARVEWTSLPGNPGTQSDYNTRSTERYYDPLSPVDIYGTEDSATISVPALPATGFAPGVRTSVPRQPAEAQYYQVGDLWLEIPALGVNIPVVGVPLNSKGWGLAWLGNRAGYLQGTAYPTWSGNTGITGHVYLPNGKPGPFVDLHTLYWGQQIIIHMDGQQYIYEVRSQRRVWPDDLSVLGHADLPTLTLITCQGYDEAGNSYRYRIAVRAVLIRIQPEAGTGSGTR